MKLLATTKQRALYAPLMWLALTVLAPSGWVSLVLAQQDGWQTFGVTRDVKFIDTVGAEVWALSSGGILVINPVDLSNEILTNTDGLLTNDFEHLLTDSNGDLWIAGLGRLIKRSAGASSFTAFPFLDQNNSFVRLYALADDQNQLWVGTDIGLALFDKITDGGQIQDNYQRFGSIPSQTDVIDLILTTDSVWVATPDGLAVGERIDPLQLKSFANWATFTSSNLPQLFGQTITSLQSFSDTIFIGVSNGAYSLRYSAVDTSLIQLPLPAGTRVFELRIENSKLALYTSRGKYTYDGNALTPSAVFGALGSSYTSGVKTGSATFLGVENRGVYWSVTDTFTVVQNSSLPGADVRDITLTASGAPLAAFWVDQYAVLSGDRWIPFDTIFPKEAFSAGADSTGALWFGTEGGGLWRYDGDSLVKYDTLNSTLIGNTDPIGENFVVIREIVSGPRYTYLANFRALNLKPVSIVDQLDPTRWISLGVAEGLNSDFITSLDALGNRLLVSSTNKGAYLFDLGPDPFVTADYSMVHFSADTSDALFRLSSNAINVARFDANGDMWLGHNQGLMRFDAGIERFVDVELPLNLGPIVTDITFGPQEKVWLSTPTGLGLYDTVSGVFDVFTSLNSGLVSDNIRALVFDPVTNFVWIATNNGISRFMPPLGLPNFDVKTVSAFPNPFVIGAGADRLRFNFSGIAEARIFAESGELVWVGPSSQGWSGENQSGAPVAAGVYIFLLIESGVESGIGKILLIR